MSRGEFAWMVVTCLVTGAVLAVLQPSVFVSFALAMLAGFAGQRAYAWWADRCPVCGLRLSGQAKAEHGLFHRRPR